MKTILSACIATSFALVALHAQNPAAGVDPFLKVPGTAPKEAKAAPGGPRVFYQLVVEVFAMNKDDALALLEEEPGGAARYERALKLNKSGKARLENLAAGIVRNGQRGAVSAIDEVRYGTEFNASGAKDEPPVATAFATRLVGDEVEWEMTSKPTDGRVDLNLALKHSVFAGMREYSYPAGDPPVAQPKFRTQDITATARLTPGFPHFLGTLNPPSGADGPGEMWLAFGRLSLVPLENAKAKGAFPAACTLECSVYSLPRAAAQEVLAPESKAEGVFLRVQALVKEGKARFENLLSAPANPGQHSTVEETTEFSYPTEFDPPGREMLSDVTTHETQTSIELPVKTENGERKTEPGSTTKTRETITHNLTAPNAPRTPGLPVTFETRNLGLSLNVETTIDAETSMGEASIVIQSVQDRGTLKVEGVAAGYPFLPLFETRSLTATVPVAAGQHLFAGTFNPPGADGVNGRTDDGRIWLVFVRALPNEP